MCILATLTVGFRLFGLGFFGSLLLLLGFDLLGREFGSSCVDGLSNLLGSDHKVNIRGRLGIDHAGGVDLGVVTITTHTGKRIVRDEIIGSASHGSENDQVKQILHGLGARSTDAAATPLHLFDVVKDGGGGDIGSGLRRLERFGNEVHLLLVVLVGIRENALDGAIVNHLGGGEQQVVASLQVANLLHFSFRAIDVEHLRTRVIDDFLFLGPHLQHTAAAHLRHIATAVVVDGHRQVAALHTVILGVESSIEGGIKRLVGHCLIEVEFVVDVVSQRTCHNLVVAGNEHLAVIAQLLA